MKRARAHISHGIPEAVHPQPPAFRNPRFNSHQQQKRGDGGDDEWIQDNPNYTSLAGPRHRAIVPRATISRPEQLAAVFFAARDTTRSAVLNACYWQARAGVITEQIDCAIGMEHQRRDESGRAAAAMLRSTESAAQS
ncbi:MAG: hypothetical protein MJE77_26930 [Proteobacteria bacterium]|nr:hypothetical protein [Pseudomonadota bacterium]